MDDPERGLPAGGNSLVRQIATELHPFQISFLTNLIMLAFVWPQLRAAPHCRTGAKSAGSTRS